jgi:stress-induced morphogen
MDSNPSRGAADALRAAVLAGIPNAVVEVSSGSPGHYSLVVRSEVFRGRSMVESHRMVYATIAELMRGDAAPVHAIDTLKTIAG